MKGGADVRILRSWRIRGSRPPRSSTMILSPCNYQTTVWGSRGFRSLKALLLKALISLAMLFLLFSTSYLLVTHQSRIEFPALFSSLSSTILPPFLLASPDLEFGQQVQQVQQQQPPLELKERPSSAVVLQLPTHAQPQLRQRSLEWQNFKSIRVPVPIINADDRERLSPNSRPSSPTGRGSGSGASRKTLTNDTAEGHVGRGHGQGRPDVNYQERDSDDNRAAQKGDFRKSSKSLTSSESRTATNGSYANSEGKRNSSSKFTQTSRFRPSSSGPDRSNSSSRRKESTGGSRLSERGINRFDRQNMQEQDEQQQDGKIATKSEKDITWLKLEKELLAAKLSISEATPDDFVDPELYPDVYRNVSAFDRSYKLMEKIFRIYVYQEGDRRMVNTGPVTGIYCSEGKFIEQLKQEKDSVFVEQDPEKAHMFFLPYSVAQMVETIYVEWMTHPNGTKERDPDGMSPLKEFVKDYVNEVAAKYKFWNRSHGADHFFVACHDWGPRTARRHDELRTNSVKVVCNADLHEDFVLGKDASLPEMHVKNSSKGPEQLHIGGPGPGGRSSLAFFAGEMHGTVRSTLIENWKGKNYAVDEFKFYDHTLARRPVESEGNMTYVQHMKNSKYCICPAGYEVNSPRIVEAIYYDCVPVIIADRFVLPFSDVLDWSKFSVVVAERDIPELRSILLSIPLQRYVTMQERLSKVRHHFLWNDPPVKYDAFHMILHSVWTSRLNRLNLTK